jgi:hypothetical protein
MSGELVKPLDPDLLLEASRVMNAAGEEYANATRLVSDWALKSLPKAGPATRAAILGDAAALRLRTPGHYDEALEKLQEIDNPQCPDPDGRLHMLRALANGQKYTALKEKNKTAQKPEDKTSESILSQLRQQIREDLATAFQRDKTARRDNQGYWQPPTTAEGEIAEDDLRQAYLDDPEFRKLVETPGPGDESAKPSAQSTSAGDPLSGAQAAGPQASPAAQGQTTQGAQTAETPQTRPAPPATQSPANEPSRDDPKPS